MGAERGTVETNGIRLAYRRWGNGGNVVLLLHGSSHCAGVWGPVAERLTDAGLTVVAADLRGHGQSDKPAGDAAYAWRSLRDDIIGLVRTLDLRRFVIGGHSRGGGTALLTAAALPERVAGAFLYEPSVPPPGAHPGMGGDRAAAMRAQALRRRTVFPSRAELIDRYRRASVFRTWDDAVLHAFVDAATEQREDGSVALLCPPAVEDALYAATFDRSDWEGVRCPDLRAVAVFGGAGGRIGDGKDPAAALRAIVPRVEVRVLPGATHFGPMEFPAVFAAELATAARGWLTPNGRS